MFRFQTKQSQLGSTFARFEIIFHAAVRQVRKSHGNAVIGLLMNIFQTVLMLVMFYAMMTLMGMRQVAIRGDFVLYVMSGIFMFMTHTKAVSAVTRAEGPTSAMMKHSPMNPVIAICAAALGALYMQVLSMVVVLYGYHVIFTPVVIYQPLYAFGMLLLSWASGVAIGMIFFAAMPWQPDVVGILSAIYQRANMIASGKMFLANMMSTSMLAIFDWNPLFHTIDQTRGFVFLNYHPHYSNIPYPIKVTLVCMAIGLMAEFYTRKHASHSWGAKR